MRDDVLQILVALQHLLHAARDRVVLLADDVGRERLGGGGEGIDGRVDAEFRDRALEHDGRVEVREGVGGRGIGQVVRGDVDGLERGDRAVLGRGDAFLQLAHFGGEGRLVTDRARRAAEQRGDFRARLREAENVVDEEEHVLVLLVAEIFGHGERAQGDAHTGAGRLVHLAVDERDLGLAQVVLLDDARLGHFMVKIVALARALADAGEDGVAAVHLGDVVDQLHDDDGLADAGAAERADLAALGEGADQVDDLDAGLEHLRLGVLVEQRGGGAMDRDNAW